VTQDELPTILYNPRQLAQVFQNLVGNALKYRREVEPPRIYISVHRSVTDWVFSVRDNGIGFDAEEGERIFEVFKRLHGPAIEGTGIGLSICKRIVENHGGRIWAESEPGVGSRFYFTVPIDPVAPAL
jgi:signal transduction histidine kinase